ncbi:MAG: OmpA family protein [Bacteroidota bacterium]|nr:OmpA family protein [Bacteroidota bacterium]MDP4230813.1 OmpA family protein [Bacteroidota bacterium]MDP4235311.1 OmpA family protein [Bacteroidota bacterium]
MVGRKFFILLVLLLSGAAPLYGQKLKEIEKRREASRRQTGSGLRSLKGDILFEIKNVDITHFPEMSVIFNAVNNRNVFVKTLKKEDIIVLENGIQRPVISLNLISSTNRVPIDIVFVIDQTASMRDIIGPIKDNIKHFAEQIRARGFDYRFGLVTFSDTVEKVSSELTDDVEKFKTWVAAIETAGGGDIKENALEGIKVVATMPLRPIAIRLAVVISDAEYHQKGEHGDGTTEFTSKSMGDYLYEREVRLITVSLPENKGYWEMAQLTEGASFDLGQSFDSVLTGIASDITSLYALRYISQSTLVPDSVRIDILRSEDRSPIAGRKLIALEEGKRFVFEDLLFQPNQAALASEFVPELERVVRLLHVRPAMTLRIEGHADLTGTHEKNMELSVQRAEAVRRYLIQSGIEAGRLQTIGYGDTRPIADNSTEEGRRLNRRIEFVILTK